MTTESAYDWAQAILDLACSKATDLNELANAASLDPRSGDFSDADLSHLDLSGQNLSGWNLENADLRKTKLQAANLNGTSLLNATLDIEQLVLAKEWELAQLSDATRAAAMRYLYLRDQSVHEGRVKWFNATKGYGFIQPEGGGKDVFVHISAVERSGLSLLKEGQYVRYEIVANRGKESAENLKVKIDNPSLAR